MGLEREEFDVFTKAPFSKKANAQDGRAAGLEAQALPGCPKSVDIFGCTPFQPFPSSTGKSDSHEDLFGLVPFEEITGSQQQKVKERSLQKLSSRQRRTKQGVSKSNGKRHPEQREEDAEAPLPHPGEGPQAQEGGPPRLPEQQ